jgi:Lon protease-like protein
MSATSTTVQVNFAKPFPLFPLDSVVLLPHAMLRLFVFEARYRQMVDRVLDGSGQIAMAVFDGESWREQYEGAPPIKPAVCLGQIARHERLPDGNYRIWLHGVCRARIVQEFAPDDQRLYRQAVLQPLGAQEIDESTLEAERERLMDLLGKAPLSEVPTIKPLVAEVREREITGEPIPTPALLEVLGLSVLARLDEPGLSYRLLEEADVHERARITEAALKRYERVLTSVRPQFDEDAPSGITWN